MTNAELFAVGQNVLAAQSFSQLLGARLAVFLPGEAVIEIPVRADLLQQNGFVHGGVLSFAADNALTFVGGSVLGPNVLTSEFKINYLRPALGDTLVARGKVISAGKRQAVCRCDISVFTTGAGETLCAIAQGTIVAIASEDRPPGSY
ncbi:MAG: PaaI family thioesterase [Thermaerobacter sp.]|nr:PaaI family thioesterase [Thermaerobacter sp.]